jgi:hypothetical protein
MSLYTTLALVTSTEVDLFGLFMILCFLGMFALSMTGIWLARRRARGALCPYSRTPLRRCTELPYQTKINMLRFLFNHHQYDNRIFALKRAIFSRDTGRVFQDAVTWCDLIKVDWTFLRQRYPGSYVSWGSLTSDQQEKVRSRHDTLEGFQTELSSPMPQPSAVEPTYVYAKPGPLYVDLDSCTLLGWKCVPDTELEVLIVQKPRPFY